MDLGFGVEDDEIFDNCHERTKEPCKDPYSAKLCEELWFNSVDVSGVSNVDAQTVMKYRGDVAYEEGDYENALMMFQHCQDLLQPNNISMRRGVEEDRARCHLRLGQIDKALGCARNVVALAQNFEQVTATLLLLLDVYEAGCEMAEMMCIIKKLLLFHPNNSGLWIKLGDLYSSTTSLLDVNHRTEDDNISSTTETTCHWIGNNPIEEKAKNIATVSADDFSDRFNSMSCSDVEYRNDTSLRQQKSVDLERLNLCLTCFVSARLLLRSIHCRLNSFAKAKNEQDQLKVESQLDSLLVRPDAEERLQRCSEFLKVALNLTEADETMASTNKICGMTPRQVLCEDDRSVATFDRKWFSWKTNEQDSSCDDARFKLNDT